MFGQLLESRATRQRRTGGIALSIVAHLAIITAVTVATASGKSRPGVEAPTVIPIKFAPPPKPAPTQPIAHVTTSQAMPDAPRIAVPRQIQVPVDVPVGLPPIDLSQTTSTDEIVLVTSGGSHAARPGVLDVGPRDDAPSSGEWNATELMMRIVSSAKPRYPESLRQAGIDGRVLLRFTVDTLGRIDMASVQVLQSTHDLFTRAVRDILPSYRFKPAEVGGKHVRSLAEMPFEFAITR